MSINIYWPVGEIQDGQSCIADAVVSNGTAPYTYTWGGQFDNSYAGGDGHFVSGYTSSSRPNYLVLDVTDANNPSASDSVSWAWGAFNDDCAI